MCVRCGCRPRAAAEAWLCSECVADSATYAEAADARDHGATVGQRRHYAIAVYGWRGGWPAMRER
jgi:hypothetical protein